MAIRFGMWPPWRSARPTRRHGSWCSPSGRPARPRSDLDGRSGPRTRLRPPRNRRFLFRRSTFPTPPYRGSWLSDWREVAGAELRELRRIAGGVGRLRGDSVRDVTVRSDLRQLKVE